MLKTDYKDQLLNTSVNTERKYNMLENSDGTVSFADATVYSQNGDTFGASDINAVNEEINSIGEDLMDAVPYNLIPFPYYEGSHTDNGIEWTVNEDGTVTANGTATKTSEFTVTLRLGGDNPFILPSGTYSISGCPMGGSGTTYSINVIKTSESTGGVEYVTREDGQGGTFTLEKETRIGLNFFVRIGQTVENLTFKPMLVKGDTAKEFRKNFQTTYELSEAVPKGLQFRVENGKLQFRYDSEVWG